MNDSQCTYWVQLLEGPHCAQHYPVPMNLGIVDYVRTKLSSRVGKSCFLELGYYSGPEDFGIGIHPVAGVRPPSTEQLSKAYQAVFDLVREATEAVKKDDFEVRVKQP